MKKVLVTGASGFIGRNAVLQLLDCDYEVHALDLFPFEDCPDAVIWHKTDLFDNDQQKKVFESVKPTHLLHFAWYAEPGKFWKSPENLRWVKASIDLIQNFIQYGGQRVVFAGTCAEYDWNEELLSEQTNKMTPSTLYGSCKNSLQQIFASYCQQSEISYAWGRIFFLYGPNEKSGRLVSSVIRSLLEGKEVKCTHGRQVRDFMHVKDVASAFVSLLDSAVTGPVNIASGNPVELKDALEFIADEIGQKNLLKLGAIPASPSEPLIMKADVKRLQNEVKWKPQLTLKQGLLDTIQWWKKQSEI